MENSLDLEYDHVLNGTYQLLNWHPGNGHTQENPKGTFTMEVSSLDDGLRPEIRVVIKGTDTHTVFKNAHFINYNKEEMDGEGWWLYTCSEHPGLEIKIFND